MGNTPKATIVPPKRQTAVDDPSGLFGRIVSAVQLLIPMVKDRQYRFPLKLKIFGILSLLYLLSPVDILPELFLGPLGLIDDIGLLLLFLKSLMAETENYAKEQGRNQ